MVLRRYVLEFNPGDAYPKNVHTLCLISFDDYLSGSADPALYNLAANP